MGLSEVEYIVTEYTAMFIGLYGYDLAILVFERNRKPMELLNRVLEEVERKHPNLIDKRSNAIKSLLPQIERRRRQRNKFVHGLLYMDHTGIVKVRYRETNAPFDTQEATDLAEALTTLAVELNEA